MSRLLTLLRRRRAAVVFLLRDLFTTDRAAGAVNGTQAEPTGGTRTVNDTASHMTISGGKLTVDGNGAASGDPRVVYASRARALGRLLMGNLQETSGTSTASSVGWFTSATPTTTALANAAFGRLGLLPLSQTNLAGISQPPALIELAHQALVLRAAGYWHFARADRQWQLYTAQEQLNTATLWPAWAHTATGQAKTLDDLVIPDELYIPVPITSDSFNRADGALGSTDGLGSPETNGAAGYAWTAQLGTWAVSSNAAGASALDGGTSTAAATVSPANLDTLIAAKLTRTAGNVGLVARYLDANNYIRVYHDGTNVVTQKVVAGTPTTVNTTVRTYSAGARLSINVFRNICMVLYNDTQIINALIVDGDLQRSALCGMYTTDTANRIDDFQVWAHGSFGEYTPALDRYVQTPQSATRGHLMICFDDGYTSVYTEAYPYMAARGMTGTCYINSDFVGTAGYMTLAMLQELHAAGWDIANHTKDHTSLIGLTQAQQEAELDGCRAWIDANVGTRASRHVAYPNGNRDANTLLAMAATGMKSGRDSNATPEYNPDSLSSLYQIPTYDVTNSVTLAQFTTNLYSGITKNYYSNFLFHRLVSGVPAFGYEYTITGFQQCIDVVYARHTPLWTITQQYAALGGT